MQDDTTKIGSLKLGIKVSKHVIVDGSERAVGSMLHTLVERPQYLVLEGAAPRIRIDDRLTLAVGKLVIRDTKDVHLNACRHQSDFRLLVFGDPRGRGQGDR